VTVARTGSDEPTDRTGTRRRRAGAGPAPGDDKTPGDEKTPATRATSASAAPGPGKSTPGKAAPGKAAPGKVAPARGGKAGGGADAPAKVSMRQRMSERVMKIGFLRRRYIKRVLKYIDKTKAKGKELPPEMADLARYLSAVPKAQRAERFEEAILAQQSDSEPFNRELRRAAANQNRRSGKGAGGYRPGSPPRSMQPGPRPSKKPR